MDSYLFAGLNGVASLAIIFVCICRADKMVDEVLIRVKAQYVVLVMASAGNAASPWLFEMPGWPQTAFTGAVLFMLVADSYQWRGGPPESATDHAPLGER